MKGLLTMNLSDKNLITSFLKYKVEQIQERTINNKKYNTFWKIGTQKAKQLKDVLTFKQWNLCDDYVDIIRRQCDLFCEEVYIQGFKDAIRLMNDNQE